MQEVAKELSTALQSLGTPDSVLAAGDVAVAAAKLQVDLVTEPFPDLSVTPLEFEPWLSPQATGAAMASAYGDYARQDRPSLPTLLIAACERVGAAHDCPERRVALAAAVMASVANANAYHNLNHTREVLASAIWLSRANAALADRGAAGASALTAREIASLLLLATLHDIGHDGGSNLVMDATGEETRIPFRLEDRAFAFIAPLLRRAGLTENEVAIRHTIIRATDPAARAQARAVIDHTLWGLPPPAEIVPEFLPLQHDTKAAQITALLMDADILSSAALTTSYQTLQNARLEAETGSKISTTDILYFLDTIVGGTLASAAGRLLSSNLQTIRTAVAGMDEGRPGVPPLDPA